MNDSINSNIACLYHRSDLDGHCSAAIVRKYATEHDLTFTGIDWDYGDAADIFLSVDAENTTAVIVDLCPPVEIFRQMIDRYDDVIWIDHHVSAIKEIEQEDFYDNLNGLLNINIAACELTYMYFFNEEKVPTAIRWLSQYDTFDQNDDELWNKKILPFQYGVRIHQGLTLEDSAINWDELFDAEQDSTIISDIIDNGLVCLKYEKSLNRIIAKNNHYTCEFEGHLAVVLNHSLKGSAAFESIVGAAHNLMINWRFEHDHWVVGLYSDDIDCSALAKKHGGGGHTGAAGFTLFSQERCQIFSLAYELTKIIFHFFAKTI